VDERPGDPTDDEGPVRHGSVGPQVVEESALRLPAPELRGRLAASLASGVGTRAGRDEHVDLDARFAAALPHQETRATFGGIRRIAA